MAKRIRRRNFVWMLLWLAIGPNKCVEILLEPEITPWTPTPEGGGE